jgi:uncharacterized protein (TIGR02391 family)
MARWDDIEILQTIDRLQQQMDGRPLWMSGHDLMKEVAHTHFVEEQRMGGFLQELFITHNAGLITFSVTDAYARPDNPNFYLQQLRDLALTVDGQDRARGRAVVQPLPDPDEDDGRQISRLIFKQIATAIAEEYAPDEVAVFLAEEGIPPPQLPLPEDMTEGDAQVILASLWRWGSEGRRIVRRFIGRWLDDRLLTGPDPELRARLIEQLARQGWRVRIADAALVIDEPVRGIPVGAPFLRPSRLHPAIEVQARPQFLIGRPDQGVFAAMKAVEVRVRALTGLGNDTIGVALMNNAFGPKGHLTDPAAVPGEQDGTRALFAGAMAVLRNPTGHREVNYSDISEAAEAVQTASLLMRILDQVEARLSKTRP